MHNASHSYMRVSLLQIFALFFSARGLTVRMTEYAIAQNRLAYYHREPRHTVIPGERPYGAGTCVFAPTNNNNH